MSPTNWSEADDPAWIKSHATGDHWRCYDEDGKCQVTRLAEAARAELSLDRDALLYVVSACEGLIRNGSDAPGFIQAVEALRAYLRAAASEEDGS